MMYVGMVVAPPVGFAAGLLAASVLLCVLPDQGSPHQRPAPRDPGAHALASIVIHPPSELAHPPAREDPLPRRPDRVPAGARGKRRCRVAYAGTSATPTWPPRSLYCSR